MQTATAYIHSSELLRPCSSKFSFANVWAKSWLLPVAILSFSMAPHLSDGTEVHNINVASNKVKKHLASLLLQLQEYDGIKLLNI